MAKAVAGSTVAVLGASTKEERYSFKAVRMLKEYGFSPIPVHPAGHTVDGIDGVKSLTDISQSIDTLTVYVNAKISAAVLPAVLNLKPRRVIFNPGAENPAVAQQLADNGIEVVEGCTLVMLRTEQY